VTIPAVYRVLASLLLAVGTAGAADQQVLGRVLLVKEAPTPGGKRMVVIGAREQAASLTVTGSPDTLGGTLQIIANGGSPSTQFFSLPAFRWVVSASGAVYRGLSTDPVRRVILRKSGHVAVLKAVVKAGAGMTVAPPNPGDDGGLVLELGGGDRYCVSLGGAAGGTERRDDASRWKITGATAKPGCPASTIPTTTSSTTSTTMPLTCGTTWPACDGTCPPGYHCEDTGSLCFCFTGGSDLCTTCDTPCSGMDECAAAIETTPPYLVHCGCTTPPLCGPDLPCGGNCPQATGAACVPPSPGYPSCSCFIF
jgi:hypothetical protein